MVIAEAEIEKMLRIISESQNDYSASPIVFVIIRKMVVLGFAYIFDG